MIVITAKILINTKKTNHIAKGQCLPFRFFDIVINVKMKFNTPSSVALMKTFYNFVVRPNRQRHNISESVSLIPVPKSGKFQTCAGRATTLITVLPYPLISHIRCGVLFIHPHIGFSRTSEQMNGQTPHFRVFNNQNRRTRVLRQK